MVVDKEFETVVESVVEKVALCVDVAELDGDSDAVLVTVVDGDVITHSYEPYILKSSMTWFIT